MYRYISQLAVTSAWRKTHGDRVLWLWTRLDVWPIPLTGTSLLCTLMQSFFSVYLCDSSRNYQKKSSITYDYRRSAKSTASATTANTEKFVSTFDTLCAAWLQELTIMNYLAANMIWSAKSGTFLLQNGSCSDSNIGLALRVLHLLDVRKSVWAP